MRCGNAHVYQRKGVSPHLCVIHLQGRWLFGYFVTSKRSAINGKATHFEANPKASVCYFLGGDSVTLIGNVEFIEDRAVQESIWKETDRKFFKKGLDDPKFRLIHFHTIEATFWIEGKFRTCKYK